MDHPPAPETTYDFLTSALEGGTADAFVHVADRFDDDLRYLTRFVGPDRDYAFVYADGEATLCAPTLFAEQAEAEFSGDRVLAARDQAASDPADRAVEVLDEYAADRVLVPDSISRSAATTLARSGYDLEVTRAVTAARLRKSDAERECLRSVQAAAQTGMARAEEVLAAARVDGGEVRWEGAPLTTERLRREINAELARCGVRDAGYTVVGSGPSCADLHFTGTDDVRPGETVLIDLSPRGPHGYYGDFTRTFVVGEPSEWALDAYEAVEAAQDEALAVLERGAGTIASAVHDAVVDRLAADGFAAGDVDVGLTHGTGHGLGVRLHEGPSLTDDRPLEAGHVVTVEPGVYDPAIGGVRLEDLVVVTEGGYENLTAYPRVPEPGTASLDW